MTSDFNPRPDPKPFGTAFDADVPSDVTVGGSSVGSSGGLPSDRASYSGSSYSGTSYAATSSGGDRGASAKPADDENRLKETLGREASSAKAEAGAAIGSVKDTAASLASTAKAKAAEGVEKGRAEVTSSLGDFAAAVRKASDELGERDQSMAAGLVREVATGLEQAAGAIKGQSIQDITRSVAAFARRQPTTFLIGAALAGVALGRFARASGEHASPAASNHPSRRPDDRWREDRYSERSFNEGGRGEGGRSFGDRDPSPSYRSTAASSGAGGTTFSSGSSFSTSARDELTSGRPSSAPTGGTSSSSGTSTSGSAAAPGEGPSPASLGHGSGSFNPGDRDVR